MNWESLRIGVATILGIAAAATTASASDEPDMDDEVSTCFLDDQIENLDTLFPDRNALGVQGKNGLLLGPYLNPRGHYVLCYEKKVKGGGTVTVPVPGDEALCSLNRAKVVGSRIRDDLPPDQNIEHPEFNVYRDKQEQNAYWKFHVKGDDKNTGEAFCLIPMPRAGDGDGGNDTNPPSDVDSEVVALVTPGSHASVIGTIHLKGKGVGQEYLRATPQTLTYSVKIPSEALTRFVSNHPDRVTACVVNPVNWQWGGPVDDALKFEAPQLDHKSIEWTVDGTLQNTVIMKIELTARQQVSPQNNLPYARSHDMQVRGFSFTCGITVKPTE